MGRLIRFMYGCEISYLADIDRTVVFPHKGLGVVVGDEAVIGPGCRILQNVTIGGRSGMPGGPVLGRDVLVGAGACLLGAITIGDGAIIGANAVVLADVPAGHTAVGVPARLIAPTHA
ncbi:DapH/DapD/GlmU-related protein [Phycicoccus sp. M110.8]|uniref:serine O-acetyltransferase n=1 Tax=Phycicoccus sp. M110.8 TaxID=3075433 RepID=UPI0028FD1085|nr:DapH/DapD/GlmU-related protein [Phycicoccus sp. M110.8]MDU0314725.1 DapH/DapD/GlmU-related protein [Phycicoccus sp. M110.8]